MDRRVWLALGLLLLLLLSGGCLYIPATGLFQVDGRWPPERLIKHDKKIVIGETHIVDAVVLVSERTPSNTSGDGLYSFDHPDRPGSIDGGWNVSADGKSFRRAYTIREGTVLWFLVSPVPVTRSEWITLIFDDQGILQSYRIENEVTSELSELLGGASRVQWYHNIMAINPRLRLHLQSVGLMSDDEALRARAETILRQDLANYQRYSSPGNSDATRLIADVEAEIDRLCPSATRSPSTVPAQ